MADKNFASGFDVLLRDCLRVEPGEDVLVIYDESIAPYWDALLDSILAYGCSTMFANLPVRYQEAISAKVELDAEVRLPIGLYTAIDESQVVVTMVTGNINLASVRRAIVHKATGLTEPGKRLAHIPGLSAEILDVLTRSPIAAIEQDCEALAWALGEGQRGELISTDVDGHQHVLACELGGWANEPLMSPGVIYHDSWGNVPPGETFCCPAPASVNGSVVINGSVPGYVCAEGEEVVLTFEDGRLTGWRSGSKSLLAFFDAQKGISEARSDFDWCSFAELGVGLNPAINKLTGNSLFDEKMAGTIHVAIGDNSGFGHSIKSHIHADLVIRRPTLHVNGRCLIDQGNLRLDNIERWRADVLLPEVWADSVAGMDFLHERFEKLPRDGGVFSRRLHSRGRTGYVTVARDDDARTLRQIWECLAHDDVPRGARQTMLEQRIGLTPEKLSRLLAVLVHYRMVALTSS